MNFVYPLPIFWDQISVKWAEVIKKSILSKNQFDLTVSKSERFLLSPHLRDKREVFRAEVIHK